MSEMDPRGEAVMFLYRAIERHFRIYVSCTIDLVGLERAKRRIRFAGHEIDWRDFTPYYVAWRGLMDMFHFHRDKFTPHIPETTRINFHFDENRGSGKILRMWPNYLAHRPPALRAIYGARPEFHDDSKVPALQAADFWAWWVREWADRGEPDKAFTKVDFDTYRPSGPRSLRLYFNFDEEALAITLANGAASEFTPSAIQITPIESGTPISE